MNQIPVKVLFEKGDYDDRQIILSILNHNNVRERIKAHKLGLGLLAVGRWAQTELNRRDLSLTEILEYVDLKAAGVEP